MKKILIIHTGGTISMVEDSKDGVLIDHTSKNPISDERLLESSANVSYFVEEPFHLPSPHITPDKMLQLSVLIKKYINEENITGAVITHGTDTLEETAYFLELTIDSSVPIAVTGAMRSSNELGSDGPSNLRNAIFVVSSDEAIGKGVMVVINEEIHAAKDVTKTHTSNLSTFQSPQFGPIGVVSKNGVYFHHQPILDQKFNISSISKKVHIIKAYSGIYGDIFDLCLEMNYDGLVIEALGKGNLPPSAVPSIEKLIKNGIPIVIVSRCYSGFAGDVYNYVGGGVGLKKLGAHFAKGLNGQKARLKLIAALSCDQQDPVDLNQVFK